MKLTYDDFVLFPDDGKRHELIRGAYVTPSPNTGTSGSSPGSSSWLVWVDTHRIGQAFFAYVWCSPISMSSSPISSILQPARRRSDHPHAWRMDWRSRLLRRGRGSAARPSSGDNMSAAVSRVLGCGSKAGCDSGLPLRARGSRPVGPRSGMTTTRPFRTRDAADPDLRRLNERSVLSRATQRHGLKPAVTRLRSAPEDDTTDVHRSSSRKPAKARSVCRRTARARSAAVDRPASAPDLQLSAAARPASQPVSDRASTAACRSGHRPHQPSHRRARRSWRS